MPRAFPPRHGRTHLPGGSDPIWETMPGGDLTYLLLYRKVGSRAQTLSTGASARIEYDYYRTNDDGTVFALAETPGPPTSSETPSTDFVEWVRIREPGVYHASFWIRFPTPPTNRVEITLSATEFSPTGLEVGNQIAIYNTFAGGTTYAQVADYFVVADPSEPNEPFYLTSQAVMTGGETIAIGTGGASDYSKLVIVKMASTGIDTEINFP